MGKIAFIFPGQGSQKVGMGKSLADSHEGARKIFSRADETLHFPLSNLIFEGPQEELTLTVNAQPALLTTSIAILEYIKNAGISPDYVAGHSLGEYTALVASGAVSFEEAVLAVRKRGEFMEEAVPNGEGTMAAVLGLERTELEGITKIVSEEGYSVQLANINCPGQIVISGSRKGVEKASKLAKDKGAKRVLSLDVSGPFHSNLMKPASEKLQKVLNGMDFREAITPIVANVSATIMTDPVEIKDKLIQQLYSPVLWEDSVRKMVELGVDTFIEIGPGKVLSGLIKKINRNVLTCAISDEKTFTETMDALKERIP